MRIAKTIAKTLAAMTPLVACADVPQQTFSERDLGIAISRAQEVRLAPHVPNVLWFRLSAGHYKSTRPEFVASFRYGPPKLEDGPVSVDATLVEVAEPIIAQVSAYIRENPAAPLEAAAQAVRVERYEYREETCPDVRAILNQFGSIAATAFDGLPDPQDLAHGGVLQIEGYTAGMYFSLFAQEGNALYAWGIEAASALKLCPTQ